MKGKWLRRIISAVTGLAMAASVFVTGGDPGEVYAKTTVREGNKIVNTTTVETTDFNGYKHETTVYLGEIQKDGVTVLTYLYSGDITRSSVVFDNLRKALNNPWSDQVPVVETTSQGLWVTSSSEVAGKIVSIPDSGWDGSAVKLLRHIYNGSTVEADDAVAIDKDKVPSEAIDADAVAGLVAERSGLDEPISTKPNEFVSHLDTRSDVILTYLSEKTKLIYTCVNYTQDGDTVKILEYYYGTPTGSSSSDDDDDGRSAEEERNLEYAKTHPGGAHTYIQQVVSDPTGEKDGVMINVCRHCGFVEKGSEQVISAYGNFNAIVLASVKNAQAGGTAEMETARWISVHRRVLEALAGNPGVTLKIHFIYEGTKHVLTIPGNDSRLATLLEREDEYFGFMFLGTMFPMATEE